MKKQHKINLYKKFFSSKKLYFVDKKYQFDKEYNRIIPNKDRNIFSLFDFYFDNKLNKKAKKVFEETIFMKTIYKEYERIKRISKDSKFFKIRFIGYMGKKSIASFMISYNNDTKIRIVKAIDNFSICEKCGHIGTLFKIYKNSKQIRCGGCLSLQGIKNPF